MVARTGDSGSSTWSGTMVRTGIVKVSAVVNGQGFDLERSILVQPRAFSPFAIVPPNEVLSRVFNCGVDIIMLPVPVVDRDGALGQSCIRYDYSFTPNTVAAGPNAWIRFVARVNPDLCKVDWLVNPDLRDEMCQFFLQQTGTFNASSNPTGVISGANHKANVIRHEFGSSESHYADYVAAAQRPENEVHRKLEETTSSPGSSAEQFVRDVDLIVRTTLDPAIRATDREPHDAKP